MTDREREELLFLLGAILMTIGITGLLLSRQPHRVGED